MGNDGLACAALPAGSLTGAWALIQRGTCYYSDKINFAQAAGAIGVIIYQSDGIDDVTARMYVQNTGIPAVLIGNTDGKALKTYPRQPTQARRSRSTRPTAAADNPQVNTVAPLLRARTERREFRRDPRFRAQARTGGARHQHLHRHAEVRPQLRYLQRHRIHHGERHQLCRAVRGRRGGDGEGEELRT